jgi:hypothetical protein
LLMRTAASDAAASQAQTIAAIRRTTACVAPGFMVPLLPCPCGDSRPRLSGGAKLRSCASSPTS